MEIKQRLVPKTSKGRRPGTILQPQYITIHSTGNPKSTAKNEVDNLCNNNPDLQVSFHVAVDDKEAWQAILFSEKAWHAGDGRSGTGNCKSIGVEICESGDRKKTLANAVELVKQLSRQLNIPLSNVVQHNKWSGKDCPRILRNKAYIKDGLDWDWFVNELNKKEDKEVVETVNMRVNGKDKPVQRILKDGRNYVQLNDLKELGVIDLAYDAGKNLVSIDSKK